MIFRITYTNSDGKNVGMTFGKRNLALACQFAYEKLIPWVESLGAKNISEVKEVKQ